jgi:uncharacterized SAM-binding protein YcdF (DUF218 family)
VEWVRRHPVLTAGLSVLLVILGVLATTALAVWQSAHTDDASRINRVDAIVVLGAAQYGGRPSPVFVGRLDQGRLLFEQDRAAVVLVLGAGQPGDVTTEAQAGRDYLIEEGVPPESVVAVPEGGTTFQSLQAAARVFDKRGWTTAFLVSDPWHNLRIKRMAGDLGIEAYASATWQSAARTEGTRLAGYARETFAYLYYRLFGR